MEEKKNIFIILEAFFDDQNTNYKDRDEMMSILEEFT